MNFYLKVTLAVAVLVGAALALMFLLADAEEEVIAKLFESAVAAAQKGDAETVVRMVSREYRAGAEDYEAVVARVRRVLREPQPGTLEMTRPGVQVDGDEARATVAVKMRAGPREFGEAAFRVELRKEQGAWKVTRVEEVR